MPAVTEATTPAPLTAEDIEALEPTYLGPTWRRHEDGSWDLPRYTLGWQILGWCAEYLNNFDGSPHLRLTDEQARFILWWYAVDEHGDFVYDRGVLQRLKGAGKDPLLAVLAVLEFVGPCRFSHWGDDGQPVAMAHPTSWVQVAAVSRDQTRNTMTLLPTIMSARLVAAYGIKATSELARAHNGRCRLEAVTSSYRALEGGRATFVVLNETQHWVFGNSGHQMYETIDGNATKMKARYLAITNAFMPGEDSVAERMRLAFEKIRAGEAVDFGFMYDSIEAHPNTPLTPEALRIVLPKIRGDAVWLDVEAVIKSMLNTAISPARTRRMFLNQVVADKDALITEARWRSLRHPLGPDVILRPGDEVVLGFDGGHSDDDTALIAIRIKDGCAFVLGHWHRPANHPTGENAPKWEVNRADVDSEVHAAFRLYKVRAFFADVYPWDSYITDWTEAYGDGLTVKAAQGKPIAWDMRSIQNATRAHERLLGAIRDKKLCHDGDEALQRHALNARRRENRFGVSFGKESRESSRKVDLYAALMLAHEALIAYRTRRTKDEERSGEVWFL